MAGPHAGAGSQVRLLNFKRLSRSIRLRDSTGWLKIGASVVIPPGQSFAEPPFTLLMGVSLDPLAVARPKSSPNPELQATLQSVAIYDYDRDLVLAEWTRQAEPAPRAEKEESPTEERAP